MAGTVLRCLGLGVATIAAVGASAEAANLLPAGSSAAATALAAAAGSAVGAVAGNTLTKLCEILHRDTAERWLDGRSGVTENHRVQVTLRQAQLQALRAVRDRIGADRITERTARPQPAVDRFNDALSDFLDQEGATAENAAFDSLDGVSLNERNLRNAVLDHLPATFDQGLAARRAIGDIPTLRDSLANIRAAVEAAVLGELRARTGSQDGDLPAEFVESFNGTGYPDAWFDLFIRAAADLISKDAGSPKSGKTSSCPCWSRSAMRTPRRWRRSAMCNQSTPPSWTRSQPGSMRTQPNWTNCSP